MSDTPWPRRLALRLVPGLLLVAGLVLFVVGGTHALHSSATAGSLTAPARTRAGADTVEAATRPPAPPAHRAPWVPGAPHRLVIPSLHVDAPVVPVTDPDGTLTPPADAGTLGWWADGAEPGSAHGSTLIAGHTVHTGGGALDHLADVQPGASIVVDSGRQRLRYVVTSVRVLQKARITRQAGRLFEQHGRPRLVVLTCDDWDGVRYHSNAVVTAVEAPTALPS